MRKGDIFDTPGDTERRSRSGQPWPPKEEKQLGNMFRDGRNLLTICIALQRSRSDTLTRLQGLGLVRYDSTTGYWHYNCTTGDDIEQPDEKTASTNVFTSRPKCRFSAEQLEWINIQLLPTLENDSSWYHQAGDCGVEGHFAQFAVQTRATADKIFRQIEDSPCDYGAPLVVYVVLEAWHRRGGQKPHDDPVFSNWMAFATKHNIPTPWDESPTGSVSQPQPNQEPTMAPVSDRANSKPDTILIDGSAPITTVNKTYVYGTDVKTMSEGQLIKALRKTEDSIKDLQSIKTQSKKIGERITELEAALVEIVAALDATPA